MGDGLDSDRWRMRSAAASRAACSSEQVRIRNEFDMRSASLGRFGSLGCSEIERALINAISESASILENAFSHNEATVGRLHGKSLEWCYSELARNDIF